MGSRGVFQPVGQKRLTNIAVVRLKKSGHRFEIACYRNKVQDWRVGIEKDIDEVLQTTTVFTNVSKGILAKDKELQEAFGTTDQQAICLEILAKGELQVAEEERKLHLDNIFRDVAGVLAEKCINPDNGRPYTMALLERALKDVHFNVDPKRSAKQQALEALPLLQAKFPIERARMRLKLTVPADFQEELLERLSQSDSHQETTDLIGNNFVVVTQVEPGLFRELHNFMSSATKGRGRIEVVSFAVMAEGSNAQAFASETTSTAGRQTAAAGQTTIPTAVPSTVKVVQPTVSEDGSANTVRTTGRAEIQGSPQGGGQIIYPKGSIAGMPEEHASRRERFAELDSLQPGWQVELRRKGDAVEAVFYAPGSDVCVGAFAVARRQALAASKAAST